MAGIHQRHVPALGPAPLESIIVAHLDKVSSSGVFKNATNLRELLRFVVQETVAGRGRDLKEYVLGATVLGKGSSFDPKADPIVRVQMGRLREHLDRYYATEGRYDALLIDIPKGTYTPTFRVPHAAQSALAGFERFTVGRQKELSELQAAFASAAAGNGGLLCLTGEPGIGKTTVTEIFLRELTTSDADCYVARGRCSERLAGSEAYLPVLEALETLLRRGDESLARLVSAVAPTWYAQVVPLTEDPSVERIQAETKLASQERLKREFVAFLEELARRQPVVLFLEDLHWADASTIDLLSYFLNRSRSQRLLVVGTYRPAELSAANHPFARVKLELQAHAICREIPIGFLTRADVDRYLALQFPEHRFPPELSARIHDRTEGNPLFMADLVRYLRDRGVLAVREGRWVMVGQLSEIAHDLPESVRSMVQKKIGDLSDADRRTVSVAAVQGHEFDSTVVASALEIAPAEVEERLAALDRTQTGTRPARWRPSWRCSSKPDANSVGRPTSSW